MAKIAQFVIYCFTNKINGKKYIGMSKNFRQRLSQHRWAAKKANPNGVFSRALKKYGIDNFMLEIIEQFDVDTQVLSKQEINEKYKHLQELEIKYIKLLNTMCPVGYNVDPGGDGKICSDKDRARMSKMGSEQVGDKNPFFNKKHSKDSKKLMSESHKANRNAGVYVASDIAKRTFTPEKEAEIANEYAANDITIKEMMKKYQCGSSAIFRILDVYGVRKGTIKDHKQSKQKREQILALHYDGFCQKDIAEQLSISVCSVSKYLVKEGIKSFRWKK